MAHPCGIHDLVLAVPRSFVPSVLVIAVVAQSFSIMFSLSVLTLGDLFSVWKSSYILFLSVGESSSSGSLLVFWISSRFILMHSFRSYCCCLMSCVINQIRAVRLEFFRPLVVKIDSRRAVRLIKDFIAGSCHLVRCLNSKGENFKGKIQNY